MKNTRHSSGLMGRLAGGVARLLGGAGASLGSMKSAFASGYAAGKKDRLDPDFVPSPLGPNALADTSNLALIWTRARWLCDNTDLFDGAREAFTDNIVGTGIDEVEADTGFEDIDERLNELWELDVSGVDAEGRQPLGESQRDFCDELFTVGECGLHLPYSVGPSGDIRPSIELIEAERIPLEANWRRENEEVRQGVRLVRRRIAGYYVLDQTPRDGSFGGWGAGSFAGFGIMSPDSLRFISAADMELVLIRRARLGQLRGLPRFMAAMIMARKDDALLSDTLSHAQLVASLGVFFTVDNPALFAKAAQSGATILDNEGNPLTRIEGGTMGVMPKGTELNSVGATTPGPQFEPTQRVLSRRMSRATTLPYHTFSGDSSQSNYSSIRADQLDSRKAWRPTQELVWNHHTAPWRKKLIDAYILAGKLKLSAEQRRTFRENPARLYRAEIGWPGWEYSDPGAESRSNETDLRTGVRSEIGIIQAGGGNWRKVGRQRVKYEAFIRAERIAAGLPADEPVAGAGEMPAAAEPAGGEKPGVEKASGDDGTSDGNKRGADRTTKKEAARG